MTINIEEQFSEAQRKRRKRRRYVLISVSVVFCVFLLWGAWWLLFRSDFFVVNDIVIEGNKKISGEEVLQFLEPRIFDNSWKAKLFGTRHMLVWPSGEPDVRLEDVPLVKRLEIEKRYREKKIVIRITEREPYGVWCRVPQTDTNNVPTSTVDMRVIDAGFGTSTVNNSGTNSRNATSAQIVPRWSATSSIESATECWWFDDSGVLYEQALAVQGSMIHAVYDYSGRDIFLNGNILPEEFIKNLFSVFDALSKGGINVQEVRLNDLKLQEIEIVTYDGPKILFSLRFPATNIPGVIESLKNKGGFDKLQYVDFRVENRVYYK